jgi:hypothetical protein
MHYWCQNVKPLPVLILADYRGLSSFQKKETIQKSELKLPQLRKKQGLLV